MQTNDVYPLWLGHYLYIPFVSKGREYSGLDDWGLCRLVMAEQFGLAIPSFKNDTDQFIYNHIMQEINYRYYGYHLVVVEVTPGKYLFGIKLPNNRMLTVFKSGSCLAKYEHDLLGE